MRDKVWFTFKARICGQQRLAKNDFHSQAILVWYALASTILSVVSIRYPKVLGDETDLASAVFSTVLLVMSMIVANRDFRGRSIAMRSNYLALQALYNSTGSAFSAADMDRYQVLLEFSENHDALDDKMSRVLNCKGLTSRIPSFMESAHVYFYLITRLILILGLYAMPLCLLALARLPK